MNKKRQIWLPMAQGLKLDQSQPNFKLRSQSDNEANEQQTQLEDQIESVESDSTQDGENLENYMLARNRQRRVSMPSLRYGHADLISYAFNVAEDLETFEPRSLIAPANRQTVDVDTSWINVFSFNFQKCDIGSSCK